jgi:hypothetical protein
MNKNGIQIGGEGIEKFLVNMVLIIFLKTYFQKDTFPSLFTWNDLTYSSLELPKS